jgi:nicotinamide-nucleotide amidase
MFPDDIAALSAQVLDAARARRWKLATAESCTGGLVGAALTEVAGASDVVDRGFITYSNAAKEALLAVSPTLLAQFGAVSAGVARAMAEGALAASAADLAVAVTGVAGPGGGSPEKPVGLVWLAVAVKGGDTAVREQRYGDIGRTEVRLASVRMALEMLLTAAR